MKAPKQGLQALWRHALPVLLIAGALLYIGCEGSAEDVDDETMEEIASYTVGEPIEDSSYAVIVRSEYGSDTLSTPAFRERFDRFTQQLPTTELDVSQAAEIRRSIVEQFVIQHVFSGEAERLGVHADSARISTQLEQMRQQFGEERFEEMLAAQNISEEELRGMMADQMRSQAVQQELAGDVEAPTADEIETFREEQSQEIRAQHILFLAGQNAPEAEVDSVRQLAEAVLDSIESGAADFGEMARRHSEDGSAQRGGDLGYFSRGQMVPAFEEAVLALEDSGDVTEEPVRTRYGYHLIRKTGEREGAPMDTSRARQAMMQRRQQEAVREGVYELRAKAVVRINPSIVEGVDLDEPFDIMRQGG